MRICGLTLLLLRYTLVAASICLKLMPRTRFDHHLAEADKLAVQQECDTTGTHQAKIGHVER
jgi:hypothetical protein